MMGVSSGWKTRTISVPFNVVPEVYVHSEHNGSFSFSSWFLHISLLRSMSYSLLSAIVDLEWKWFPQFRTGFLSQTHSVIVIS